MQFDHLGWLAMHGAASILSKRRHPEQAWEDMRNGIFHRRKSPSSYPLVVRAYANMLDMDIADAQKEWNSMSKEKRRGWRKSPDMKYHVLTLQAEQAKAALEDDASA